MALKVQPLTAEEIVELSKRYRLFDWQAQSKAAPIAVDRARGMYFWDADGKRYLDFNSQLWSVNIRPRRRGRDRGDAPAGREAGLHQPLHDDEGARPPWV